MSQIIFKCIHKDCNAEYPWPHKWAPGKYSICESCQRSQTSKSKSGGPTKKGASAYSKAALHQVASSRAYKVKQSKGVK